MFSGLTPAMTQDLLLARCGLCVIFGLILLSPQKAQRSPQFLG
jgi:hypothetical protein